MVIKGLRRFFNPLIKSLIFLSVFSIVSCGGGVSGDGDDDGDEESFVFTTLIIGTPINDTISAYGSKVYRVNFASIGTYTLSLTNQLSDCGMTLCSYDPSDTSLDDLVDNKVGEIDAYADTTDEEGNVNVTSPGYAYIVVDEWDDIASGYTISCTTAKKSSEKSIELKMEPVTLTKMYNSSANYTKSKWKFE